MIFDRIFESGTLNFGSTQGINQILGRLYSARVEVKTLSAAYEKIGARLDESTGSSFTIRAWFDFFNESARASFLIDEGLRTVRSWSATDRSAQSTWRLMRRILERIHSFMRSVRHVFRERVTYMYDSCGNTVVFWDQGLGFLYTPRLRDVALCPPLGGRSAALSITLIDILGLTGPSDGSAERPLWRPDVGISASREA